MSTALATTDHDAAAVAREARRPQRRPKRRRVARALAALVATLGATSAVLAVAPPAQAAYTYWATDSFNFHSSNSAVQAWGNLNWFKDPRGWYQPTIYRGQYDAYVQLRTAGCLYAKVDIKHASGTVSWPPSGTSSTTSDGWYRRCGAAGTYISLVGVASASRESLQVLPAHRIQPVRDPPALVPVELVRSEPVVPLVRERTLGPCPVGGIQPPAGPDRECGSALD